MANSVYINLSATGNPESLDHFTDCIRERSDSPHPSPLSFERMVITPSELLDPAYPSPLVIGRELYGWRCEHWGTWSDARNAELTRHNARELTISFDTAWSFPEPVIRAMVERFPDVSICGGFVEECDNFHGEFDGADVGYEYGSPEVDD